MTGERVAKFPTPRFPDGEIEYVPLPRSSEDMLIELHREIGNQPKTRSARLYQLHHEIADHIDSLRAQVAALAGEPTSKQLRAGVNAYEDAMGGDRLPDGDGYDEEVVLRIVRAVRGGEG